MNRIDEEQEYELQLVDHDLQSLYIDHVRVLSTPGDKEKLLWELAHYDFITTSVWINNLPKIALSLCIFKTKR